MLAAERLQMILDEINRSGVVTIDSLCAQFNVSKPTIRRDLKRLEALNKISRTHGGALSRFKGTAFDPPFQIRKEWYIEEKGRIAEAAIDYIHNHETIILDSGTTTLELAKRLGSRKKVIIATNDIAIAMELADKKNIDLILIGGALRKDFYTLIGSFTETMLQNIRVDKVFLGADSIDLDLGFMNYNLEEIPVKRLMLKAAKEKIVLCDHSKFETIAFAKICSFDEIDRLVTGKEINPEIHRRLVECNLKVELV
jgi:DeoR/GlpR family transcriptional regulator of sugar metabolism